MEARERRQRKELARALLATETASVDEPEPADEIDWPPEALRLAAPAAAPVAPRLVARGRAQAIAYPQGLAPIPEAPQEVRPEAPLPEADVLVIT